MKRLRRDPLRFDVIDVFSEFGRQERVSVRDPAVVEGFVGRVRASVESAQADEALLHGRRTESMFAALAATLGTAEIIKQEDTGDVYASDDALKVPDFRLVLRDGIHMLVEVKNFFQGQRPLQAFEMEAGYLSGLTRYATAMGWPLFIAVFWTKWNVWTLVPAEAFQSREGVLVLEFETALRANHMASLGDYSIGTRFPLSFIMLADPSKPRGLGSDGVGEFTVSGIDYYCADTRVVDRVEQRIAAHLMFWGDWQHEELVKVADGSISGVEHRWMPPVDNQQGFEIVGSVSTMFSRFYKFLTQDKNRVAKLELETDPPPWGSLVPRDYRGAVLPIWRFSLQPTVPDGTVQV